MFNLKTIVNNLWRDAIMWGLPELARYKVLTHPTCQTAFWSWKDNPRPGEHKIYIGEKSIENCTKKDADEIYIQSLLYHELAHSKWTDKDIKYISQWCKDNKVPFNLFNLFEDARIESLFRATYSRLFRWSEYEKGIKNSELKPTSALFKLIQAENRKVRFPATFVEGKRVRDYYERIIACEETLDLQPILLEWIDEFPPEESDADNSSSDSSSDPLAGEPDIIETEEQEARLDEESEEVFDSECFDTGNHERTPEDEESYPIAEFSVGEISRKGADGVIAEEYERYIPIVEKLFQDKKGYVNTSNPSKRLNRRGLIGVSESLYRKKEVQRSAKRNVNVVIDCSGSMGGDPIANARAFVKLLNELARKGKIEGHVILTSVKYGIGNTETRKLPVTDEFISGIPANGGAENIAGTINLVKPLLKKADYNFFVTDGCITDDPVNKAKLRKEGIYTFGLYVGDFKLSRLAKWFDRFIVRDSLEGLINEMLRKVK
jgi:hypothetical protein